MQEAAKKYEEIKATCTAWPLEEVTHVFYHTLIKDPSKAFDGDYKEADYNQVMTTIDEFNKITQTMYDKGYVMVSINDMAKADDNGNITEGEILLPPGKTPFVLSQDDVCYYHYMDGDGYATKLIVDDKGNIRNEYVEDDGSVSVGDYDMVPLIDRFVEEHPDFSYRGAKGIVALTGYNGILDTVPTKAMRPVRQIWMKIKYSGWMHIRISAWKRKSSRKKSCRCHESRRLGICESYLGTSECRTDFTGEDCRPIPKIQKKCDPLIGGTDIIIFAFGTDLTNAADYSGDKFEYLKGHGI